MAIATNVQLVADLTGPAGTTEANAKFTELERAKWLKGRLPNGTNVHTFTTPGVWLIPSQTAVDSMIGLAENYPSILVVTADSEGSTIIFHQKQIVHKFNRSYSRTSGGTTGGGPYNPWSHDGGDYGRVTPGYNLGELRSGWITLSAPTHQEVIGIPDGAGPGMAWCHESFLSPIFRFQMYFEYGGTAGQGRLWLRASNGSTQTSYAPWRELTGEGTSGGGGTVDYAVENPFANEQLKQWFIRRRGGFIGTGGVACVAIRIDHGAVNFRDLVLNQLVARGLPFGMALNTSARRLALSENAGVTWADYNSWARSKGMEPWNHSYDHSAASSTSRYVEEIINGRNQLQAAMPASAIEGWMVPGVGANGYEGQSSTNAPDSFSGYEAGRIIMSSHAVSSGYGGGDIRPQAGLLVDGQDHLGMDGATTSAPTIDAIKHAQDMGGAVQLFLHPSVIGNEGSATVAALNEIWDFLASERDAGRLIILSPSGLLLADPSKSTRHNLLRFADFQPRNGRTWSTAWGNRTGWTTGAGGASTTGAGGVLTQVVPEMALKHCRGALYEVVAEVSSANGAVARIGSSTLSGAMKDVSIGAGQSKTIRQHVTLPLNSNADFNVSVGRVSGGALTIRNVALQPV